MILKKVYDESTKTQKVWYDSSMILYSEMVEDEYENKGNLYIVFKNGSKYVYKDVRFEDYILFLSGGSDASQGKTLNKVIKNKYEYENLGSVNVQEILEEYNKKEEPESDKENTYFISGHRNITETEFEFNYLPLINFALQNPKAKFVIGDCDGVDIMAQNYLVDVVCLDPSRITVYHMLEAPRNCNPAIKNLVGGFNSDEERDAAMTNNSFEDIAFVRDCNKLSGTGQNILRRYLLKQL
jgi:hypothetical protein